MSLHHEIAFEREICEHLGATAAGSTRKAALLPTAASSPSTLRT